MITVEVPLLNKTSLHINEKVIMNYTFNKLINSSIANLQNQIDNLTGGGVPDQPIIGTI